MRQPFTFAVSSCLAAAPERVWVHALTMSGVNAELWPLVRMTYPPGFANLDGLEMPLGQRLFRSWILFLGVLPIDYDDLTFVEFEPGRRFLERSPMLTQHLWQHERVIEPDRGGCRVTDRVEFTPRVGALGALQLPIFRFAFRLRHRNLVRLFGARS